MCMYAVADPRGKGEGGRRRPQTTKCMVFTALHGMQTRSSNENSVSLSVRPSVKHVICDKMKKKIVPAFLYHMKDHLQ